MRVIFFFYRSFLIPSIIASILITAFAIGLSGIMVAFWARLVISAALGLFFWIFQYDRFYFFENLGFSKKRLYAGALILDLSLWTAITLIVKFLA